MNMIPNSRHLVGILVSIALAACGNPPGEELAPAPVQLGATGLLCELGGTPGEKVTIQLTNRTGKTLQLLTNDTPFDPSPNEPFVLTVEGKRQRYVGERYRKLHSPPPLTLAEGGKAVATFTTQRRFDVTEEGLGELTLRSAVFRVLDEGGRELELAHQCGRLVGPVARASPAETPLGVQRDPLTSGCNASETTTINSLQTIATSVTSTSRAGAQISSTNQHYKTWFGTWTSSRGAAVTAINNDVRTWLSNPSSTFTCNASGCNSNLAGYVFGSCPAGTVCLCPNFFGERHIERLSVMVHEVSHLTSLTTDAAYFEQASLNLAATDPEAAVDNADNYAYFVAYYGRKTRSDFARVFSSAVGVWRPSDGTWYINDGVTWPTVWGQSGDVAVPGDYNGDERTDRAIFRPSTGVWWIDDGVTSPVTWGQAGDIPVPCDFNGDGKTDRAIFRPSTKTWYIDDGVTAPMVWGASGDYLVPADYTGDGKCERAVFRPSTATWYIADGLGTPLVMSAAAIGAIPIPGDYLGIGRTTPAVWHPVTGVFTFASTPLPGSIPAFGGKASTPFNVPVAGTFLQSETELPAIFDVVAGATRVVRPAGAGSPVTWGNNTDSLTMRASPATVVP